MSGGGLNKRLYTEITKLKLLDKSNAEVKFSLQTSPFTGDQEEDEIANKDKDEFLVTGYIYPNSEIYRERAYNIEMKVPRTFPFNPPEIRFLTPVYHPNVDKDGKFCNELLQKNAKWAPAMSLVQVVQTVVDHIDHPDINYSLRAEVGREYTEEPEKFKQHAIDYVRQHGLPRS